MEYPLDRVSTNVTIFITRNEFAPRFDQNQYIANISENTAMNVVVLRLNATDQDAVVREAEIDISHQDGIFIH